MTMAIDNQQRFGLNFDHVPPYTSSPQFTNPWTPSASAPSHNHGLYAPSHNPNNLHLNVATKQHSQQPPRLHNNVSMGPYAPMTTATAGSSLLADVYGSQDLLTMSEDLLSPNPNRPVSTGYGSDVTYSSASSPAHSTFAPSSAPYDTMGYAPAPVRSTYAIHQDSRRLSQSSVPSNSFGDVPGNVERQHRHNSLIDLNDRGLNNEPTRAFGDAIDASRGMLSLSSQNQDTPRNIYGPQSGRSVRGSGDSYGFPSTHSSTSSISSNSGYQGYYGGSVDSSVSDYSQSNAGSDIESVSSRTLPRPSGLLSNAIPPAPSSMMGQFSSKASSTAQKKHKCKVCSKRFTRPSSLQTHMYSHTGEKRTLHHS